MSTNQSRNSRQPIKIRDIGRLVRERRKANKLTLEEVAERTGVSAATLSRLERQNRKIDTPTMTPDTRTIAAVASWLGVPVEGFSGVNEQILQKSIPDIVEAHLRADRNLDPQAAERLGTMFRLAYEQFAKSNSESDSTPTD